jgi:hypothetical protein
MKYPLAIHVGHGKTGTSFIQSVLAINAELLSSYGLNYPVYALEDGRAKQGLISSGNGMLITEDKWQAKGPTLVSSEVLFERLLQDAALRQRISSRHGRIKIILYTRDLFDYLISGWGQYIKRHNGVLAFNDYMLDGVAQGNYHVYPLVLEWIKLAEREQFELVIVNYSRHKSDLIESFLLAALPSSASSMWSHLRFPTNKTVNRSLTLAEFAVQREFNKHLAYSHHYVSDALVNRLPDIRPEFPYIDEAVHRSVKSAFQPILESINQCLRPDERILCEEYEDLRSLFTVEDASTICLGRNQIEVLVEAIAAKISALEGASFRDFKPEMYLKLNPDVKASRMNPYEHFVKHGISEQRRYKLE